MNKIIDETFSKLYEQIPSYIQLFLFIVIIILLSIKYMIPIIKSYPDLNSFFRKKIMFNDKELKSFDEDNNDIYFFNKKYKIKASTKDQLISFIDWLKKYSISSETIKKISVYFDVENLKIKKVKKKKVYINMITSLICYLLCLIFFLIVILIDSVPIDTNIKNDPIVWISKDEARIFSPSWLPIFNISVLNNTDCVESELETKAEIMSMNVDSIKMICKYFNSKYDEQIKNSIFLLRFFFIELLCISIFVGIITFRNSLKQNCSRILRRKIIEISGRLELLNNLAKKNK